ncbi:hypothetical protein [Rhizobium leguminosarum]|jgi:hypothetical protein|uniref:hypothetical protein n=1 Tax=Rhizobium leguminosarum TaxID=384 RepID=UPI0013EE43AB|nr:hypothetical protein [Rhizobium leguminosarum]QIO78579.1 hypothetical protein HA460_05775 [Rhizobium leguminosarum bv. trifolii]
MFHETARQVGSVACDDVSRLLKYELSDRLCQKKTYIAAAGEPTEYFLPIAPGNLEASKQISVRNTMGRD